MRGGINSAVWRSRTLNALKALEAENIRLKRLLAESMLGNEVTHGALRKKVTAADKRDLVRWPSYVT